ncbi:MAG: Undecaprenyl-phosphate galactosephosphotransferase, partial [uncultured Gemmatimonadaceae bacterium]
EGGRTCRRAARAAAAGGAGGRGRPGRDAAHRGALPADFAAPGQGRGAPPHGARGLPHRRAGGERRGGAALRPAGLPARGGARLARRRRREPRPHARPARHLPDRGVPHHGGARPPRDGHLQAQRPPARPARDHRRLGAGARARLLGHRVDGVLLARAPRLRAGRGRGGGAPHRAARAARHPRALVPAAQRARRARPRDRLGRGRDRGAGEHGGDRPRRLQHHRLPGHERAAGARRARRGERPRAGNRAPPHRDRDLLRPARRRHLHAPHEPVGRGRVPRLRRAARVHPPALPAAARLALGRGAGADHPPRRARRAHAPQDHGGLRGRARGARAPLARDGRHRRRGALLVARAGDLRAGAGGAGGASVPRVQVPQHGHRRRVAARRPRGAERLPRPAPLQAAQRPPHHPARRLFAAVEPRRAAAALERAARRDVARGPAAAPPVRGGALRGPPLPPARHEAGDHGAVAGGRPQPDHRLRGGGAARAELHPPLVDLEGPLDPRAHHPGRGAHGRGAL